MKLSKELMAASRYHKDGHAAFLRKSAVDAQLLESYGLDTDVIAFQEKFNHPAPDAPVAEVPIDLMEVRIRLIQEECDELCDALIEGKLSAIAGECIDLIYVVVGTMVALGLPLMPFWREVHRANMQKVENPNGGKPIKPAGWMPPMLGRVLQGVRS